MLFPRRSEFRFILALVVALIPAVLYLSIVHPYGKLHWPDTQKFLQREEVFRKSALLTLKDLQIKSKNKKMYSSSKHTKYCLGILHVPRPHKDYLIQGVTALLTRNKYSPDKLKMFIYDVKPESDRNPGDIEALENLIQVVKRESTEEYLPFDMIAPNYETAHYVDVLRHLSAQQCDYHIVLEDDALPSFNWLDKIDEAIGKIEKSNFFQLKLLFPRKYDSVFEHKIEWLFVALGCGILTYLLRLLFMKNGSRYSLIGFSLCCGIFALSYMLIGRQYFVSFSDGVHQYQVGFCLSAVVYPQNILLPLSDYMVKWITSHRHTHASFKTDDPDLSWLRPKDKLTHQFSDLTGLQEYIVTPSVFQHIGIHTSLRFKWGENAFQKLIWAYDFPDDDSLIKYDEKVFQ